MYFLLSFDHLVLAQPDCLWGQGSALGLLPQDWHRGEGKGWVRLQYFASAWVIVGIQVTKWSEPPTCSVGLGDRGYCGNTFWPKYVMFLNVLQLQACTCILSFGVLCFLGKIDKPHVFWSGEVPDRDAYQLL